MNRDLDCSICLEVFKLPIVLSCGHTFCRNCIENQKKNSSKCPLCRTQISWGHPCYILKTIIEKYSLNINGSDSLS